jgi:proline iminopeptidase
LILRGIFLCRESEIRWLSEEGGVSQVYPEQWQRYIAPIAPEKRGALVQAYHELLFGDNDAVREQAAKAWSDWESYLIQFEPQPVDGDGHDALSIARLENHDFTQCPQNPPYSHHYRARPLRYVHAHPKCLGVKTSLA